MKNNQVNDTLAKFGTRVIVKKKYLFFLIIIIVLVFSFLGTERLMMDSSNESFIPEDDEIKIQNERFKEIFGNEEFVFIFIEADDVFTYDTLKYLQTLSEDLKENLPFAEKVQSLADIEHMDSLNDELKVEPLVGDEIPRDRESLETIRQKVLSSKMYLNRIITEDSKKTGIVITFERIPENVYLPVGKNFSPIDQINWPDDKVIMRDQIFYKIEANHREKFKDKPLSKVSDPRKLIAPALKVILNRHKKENYNVLATGTAVADFEIDQITESEGAKFGFIALIFSILLLVFLFRSFGGVIAPFVIIISTITIIYGLIGWFQVPLSVVSMIIAPLLLVISVSYSIHYINHFQRCFRRTGNRQQAVYYAYQHSAWPCFITAATTAVGFASFIVVPMEPIRNAGLACALGVMITYLLVMIIVPTFFSFGKDKSPAAGVTNDDLERTNKADSPFMAKWANFVIRHALMIAVGSSVIFALVIFASFKIEIDTRMGEMMGEKIQFVKNCKYIADRLGGLYSYEIFIQMPEDGMAKDPEILKTMDDVAREINNWESTSYTTSLNDIIKEINMVMNYKNTDYYKIPSSPQLLEQYLLLYEMSGGQNIEEWVDDYSYRFLRLSVKVKEYSLSLKEKLKEIDQLTKNKFPPGTKVTLVGDVPMGLNMIDMLTSSQIKSILAAFAAIALMLILIFKSVKVGLIAMIPNVFPVVFTLGIMGALNIPLDIITIMIAPMIIGIAVDDTIHYFIHFKQDFNRLGNYSETNRETFQKVGRAILFTSVILIAGFSIFCLSKVKSMLHMGIVASAGIFAALVADLVITPIIMVYLKPLKKQDKINGK